MRQKSLHHRARAHHCVPCDARITQMNQWAQKVHISANMSESLNPVEGWACSTPSLPSLFSLLAATFTSWLCFSFQHLQLSVHRARWCWWCSSLWRTRLPWFAACWRDEWFTRGRFTPCETNWFIGPTCTAWRSSGTWGRWCTRGICWCRIRRPRATLTTGIWIVLDTDLKMKRSSAIVSQSLRMFLMIFAPLSLEWSLDRWLLPSLHQNLHSISSGNLMSASHSNPIPLSTRVSSNSRGMSRKMQIQVNRAASRNAFIPQTLH